MRCKRCRAAAELSLASHNAAFCRACFLYYFRRQVERTVREDRMMQPSDRVLVAVSGGKDSLALWDVLLDAGYDATGVHVALGIGTYSLLSRAKTEAFASARSARLITVVLEREAGGIDIPTVKGATRRPACAACGTIKRHYFDTVARDGDFTVLATGHNLDDEAARLLGNVLHWQTDYLAKQHPTLEAHHAGFVRKVKPLYRLSEYETAAYAFLRCIDYVVEECPNSSGATQLVYKDLLNRLEAQIPGTKTAFVLGFVRSSHALFAGTPRTPPRDCGVCGGPAYAEACSFCRLVAEVQRRRVAAADRAG